MKIILAPYSKKLRNGNILHPKEYPYFKQVINNLKNHHHIIQIGISGEEQLTEDCRFNLSFSDLKELLSSSDTFITIDSFFQHMAYHYGMRGVVIFSRSDPKIYGYKENINLLKDKKYLRQDQFGLWESCEYIKDSFVDPIEVEKGVRIILSQ